MNAEMQAPMAGGQGDASRGSVPGVWRREKEDRRERECMGDWSVLWRVRKKRN